MDEEEWDSEMKPRITKGFTHIWIGTFIYIDGWDCRGDGKTGFGVTPQIAYQDWETVKWPLYAVVAQHTYPPKPTLWQRFVHRSNALGDSWAKAY